MTTTTRMNFRRLGGYLGAPCHPGLEPSNSRTSTTSNREATKGWLLGCGAGPGPPALCQTLSAGCLALRTACFWMSDN
jgi:hypothetical protein